MDFTSLVPAFSKEPGKGFFAILPNGLRQGTRKKELVGSFPVNNLLKTFLGCLEILRVVVEPILDICIAILFSSLIYSFIPFSLPCKGFFRGRHNLKMGGKE